MLILSSTCFIIGCLFQILEISGFREQLYDYLKNRMMAIAPNLTIMVGELVGARLIAHAGRSGCYNVLQVGRGAVMSVNAAILFDQSLCLLLKTFS